MNLGPLPRAIENEPRISTGCSTKLTVDNALAYLQQVEKVLSKDDFTSFLEVIEDFKHQR